LWITEAHVDVGVQAEALVIRHLFATIPGERFAVDAMGVGIG
jgi:hypothetical protein